MIAHDPTVLPRDLPVPEDDGAALHLPGTEMPSIALAATDGTTVDLAAPVVGRTVVYAYPRTGEPGIDPPDGWDLIPGARGCTPQACSFRDHHGELAALDTSVFGLSTQSTDYQREMADRLHLPFPALSDHDLSLARALGLPTFEAAGMTLMKRLTMVIRGGRIEHVFYPVFPPDTHAERVIDWLKENHA